MKKVLALVVLGLLAGCGYENTESKKIGTVENCTVYEVKVAGKHSPLYLVKCTDAELASATYSTGGKSSTQVSTTTVVQKEEEALQKKKAALAKLTAEERKLLGLE